MVSFCMKEVSRDAVRQSKFVVIGLRSDLPAVVHILVFKRAMARVDIRNLMCISRADRTVVINLKISPLLRLVMTLPNCLCD